MPGRGLHVDRDDRAFPHVGQCLYRQVVDQRTVDEQLAAANLRGRDDRQVDAEPDRLPQRSVPGNLQPSAAEIDAGTQVAARQLLHQARAEDAVQHGLEAFAADQRVAGDGEVAQRPAAPPFVVADRVDLIGVVARGEQRADHGAHADPGDTVDPEAGGGQFLEHADVRERPCATAGKHDPDRGTGQPAGHAGDVRTELRLPDQVRGDRIERGRPAGQRAGRGVVRNQFAGLQLGIMAKHRRDRSASGHRQDPVGLLQAEPRPGLVQGRSADEQDLKSWPACTMSSTGPYTAAGAPGTSAPGTSAPPSTATDRCACRAVPSSVPSRHIGIRPSSSISATVAGRGRAVPADAPESWSLRPSERFSASDRAGERCRSSVKSAWPMAMTSVARAARTDDDRGESVSKASSPTVSPRMCSLITVPAASSTISSLPARTRYISSRSHARGTATFPRPEGVCVI
jgi:hypothetical protein